MMRRDMYPPIHRAGSSSAACSVPQNLWSPLESGSSPSPQPWRQRPGWDLMILWWEGRILIPVSERGLSLLSLPNANDSTRLPPSAPAAPFSCWTSFLFSTLLTASPVWVLLSGTLSAGLAFATTFPMQPSTCLSFSWGESISSITESHPKINSRTHPSEGRCQALLFPGDDTLRLMGDLWHLFTQNLWFQGKQ